MVISFSDFYTLFLFGAVTLVLFFLAFIAGILLGD